MNLNFTYEQIKTRIGELKQVLRQPSEFVGESKINRGTERRNLGPGPLFHREIQLKKQKEDALRQMLRIRQGLNLMLEMLDCPDGGIGAEVSTLACEAGDAGSIPACHPEEEGEQ